MDAVIDIERLVPEDRERLRSLTEAPRIAWPTVIICAGLVITYLATIAVCTAGHLPLWAGCVVNSLVGYFAFSPMHDGLHRAISKNHRFNDFVCALSVMLLSPSADQRMFRYVHSLHHRFGLGPRDPDRELKGAWWTLPFRWVLIDVIYLTYVLRNPSKGARPYLAATVRWSVLLIALLVGLCVAGYGKEVLMLWFIPSRIAFLLISFAFLWLPHVPHTVSQEEYYTLATTIRQGWEPLMGVLLQGHHYHLIHHLYPTAPFYNSFKVFKVIEPQLRRHDLAVQHDFGIIPTIEPGRT